LSEDIYKKHFENSVKVDAEVTSLDEKVNTRIDEEKDKIWKELRASSLKIWEYHKEFKDDDKKLKKQVLGEYNTLKQNIKKELKEINYSSIKTDELLLKYFNELKGEISSLPEVKYYDEDLRHVRSDIKGLYKLVEDIKETNKKLQEEQQLLAETNVPLGEDPPETDNPDPLTPLDQNFVTLDQLQKHYKIFVERVQYQLSSIGGGGAGFVKDLDDVDISGITTGSLLIYEASTQKWVGIASTALSGGSASELAEDATGTNLTLSGNLVVAGIATYEDVRNIDSIGIVTARTGIKVLDGGINVVGISTISTGVGTVHVGVGSTALLVEGDARVTGILTIGTGSITLDPNERKITGIDEIIIGTGTTVRIHQDTSGEIAFSDREGNQASVGIGTTVSINTTGIITAATLKASTAFYPPLYTTSARDAGSFSQGAIIFNTTSLKLEFYDGTSWQQLPGMTLGLTVALDG
jgi:hypothetical protein